MFVFCIFFFFKQKTAYDLRISDWSSDVCSSDLRPKPWSGTSQAEQRDVAAACEVSAKELVRKVAEHIASNGVPAVRILLTNFSMGGTDMKIAGKEIGRATCRERVCQYVSISGVAVSLKKKKKNIS